MPGSDGRTYKLADYRGKQAVVLAWFPKAFTPGCTTECRIMAEHGDKLKKFDAAYFTVSVDTPEKNKEFAKSVGADYPILADPGGEVAREYGVTGFIQRWASRWTFYIGKGGGGGWAWGGWKGEPGSDKRRRKFQKRAEMIGFTSSQHPRQNSLYTSKTRLPAC